MPEITLPAKINKKYSGPILLSQFSLRLMRFHKSIFQLSLAVALGAVTIDCPLAVVSHIDSNVAVAVAHVADSSHQSISPFTITPFP